MKPVTPWPACIRPPRKPASPAPSCAQNGVVATNFDGELGNFDLSLDENGMLLATIRNSDRDVNVVTSNSTLPVKTWRHIVMTADGENLQLYEDGKLIASIPCIALAATDAETVWFGTDARATRVWGGRIDEVALFDRALTEEEIVLLHRTAQDEIDRSQWNYPGIRNPS